MVLQLSTGGRYCTSGETLGKNPAQTSLLLRLVLELPVGRRCGAEEKAVSGEGGRGVWATSSCNLSHQHCFHSVRERRCAHSALRLVVR